MHTTAPRPTRRGERDLTPGPAGVSCERPAGRGTLSRGLPARDHATAPADSDTYAGPVRTCVGCRRAAPRSVLIRVVLEPTAARAVVDSRAAMPGRGAWLHPDHGCLEQAERRRALPRALRVAGLVNTDSVWQWFTENVAT
ncbi:MAG TPA: YlxR family protein [Actinomycetaceae bacterium]|nr:YlxR family protein [Actinomycetaceae bacterium]